MANKTTASKSKTGVPTRYSTLADAANDLGLQMPNYCYGLAIQQARTIQPDNIIYLHIVDNANATINNQTGYRLTGSIVEVYARTKDSNKLTKYILNTANGPDDASAVQYFRDLVMDVHVQNDDRLCYCHVNDGDILVAVNDTEFTVKELDDEHACIDYDGYIIECDALLYYNHSRDYISTALIKPLRNWLALKDLAGDASDDQLRTMQQAYWQYSVGPTRDQAIQSARQRVALLAWAIGYINPDIIANYSNIFDNSELDTVTSPATIVNYLIGLGILSKEATNITKSSTNTALSTGYECLLDSPEEIADLIDSQQASIDALADTIDKFYIDDKLIRFDLIDRSNWEVVMPVLDYRTIDVLVDGLHDYLLRTTSEPVKQYLTECTDDISLRGLLETISGPAGFFPSDGDMALFHNCVTKYIIDAGYLTSYMDFLFAISTPAQLQYSNDKRVNIAMLRCETVKYLMTNFDWIVSIYNFDDAITPIATGYGALNLGSDKWTVPYEYNLRRNFIAKVLLFGAQQYRTNLNQYVDSVINDPTETDDNYDVVYMAHQ